MKRIFAVLLGMSCVLGPTAAFARGGFGHGGGFSNGFSTRGALRRDPTLLGTTPPVDPHVSKSDSGPAPGARAAAGHQRALAADPAHVGGQPPRPSHAPLFFAAATVNCCDRG
jgi:hypothetical protein